jgi:hypothetical protein
LLPASEFPGRAVAGEGCPASWRLKDRQLGDSNRLSLDYLCNDHLRGFTSAPPKSIFQPPNAVIVEMAARPPIWKELDGPQTRNQIELVIKIETSWQLQTRRMEFQLIAQKQVNLFPLRLKVTGAIRNRHDCFTQRVVPFNFADDYRVSRISWDANCWTVGKTAPNHVVFDRKAG